MTDAPVHFELTLRRTPAAGWALDMATEDKGLAISTAEAVLKAGEGVAARVTRETLDTLTGKYRSLLIFSRGDDDGRGRRRTPLDEVKPPLCSDATDLYTVYARETISRLLDGWLRAQNVVAFELLHRPDLVERLDATGLELQHAMQKIAIPEAHDRQISVHEVIREYQKLAEMAVTRLLRDDVRGLFPDLETGGLEACVRRAMGSGDPGYVLGVAVAKSLAAEPGRRAKIDRLLDLAETGLEGLEQALLMSVIEPLLGEMLERRETLAQLLGETPDLGGRVALMLRLVADQAVETLVAREPRLEKVFPPVPASIARLARWLRAPALAGVATALARRALADLRSPMRLHPSDPVAEITTLRALARVLIVCPRLVSPEDVEETFFGRSRHLVGPDFVKSYVSAQPTGALHEAQALTTLAENVVGAVNRRAAGVWLKTTICSLRFETELMGGMDPPGVKLIHLATLHRGLAHTGLADTDRADIAARLGALAGAIETRSRLVQGILRAPVGASQKLLVLLRLAAAETTPAGPVSQKARGEAAKLVRDPVARAELAQSPDDMGRVRDLLQATGLAAA